jgi:RNA polymerase subunit RPABC4/transcription elongation factor Spt4
VAVEALLNPGSWLLAFNWPFGSWQNSVKFLAAVVITYLIVLWVSAIIWVFRDIRDRTRDPFFQAISVFVVLVFNLAGLWLYLILRPQVTLAEAYARSLEEEALLQELEDQKACPNCRRRIADDFIVCPSCQTQLKEACVSCARPLSYSWSACPYCARPKQDSRPARRASADQPTAAMPRIRGRNRPAPAFQEAGAEPAAVITEGGESI